jgi:hypothetical protein
MASDKSKLKRQLFLTFAIPYRNIEIGRQVTSCREIFEIGSLRLIHGKITKFPTNRASKGPQHGSFKETRSRNGKRRDQIRFCGSMGNVSCRLVLALSQRLIASPSVAGSGKSVLWYVVNSIFLS